MDFFNYVDEFGPAKIIHIYEPAVDLKGIVVFVNVATSPFIGGVRIALDMCVEEGFRLTSKKNSGDFTTRKYSAQTTHD